MEKSTEYTDSNNTKCLNMIIDYTHHQQWNHSACKSEQEDWIEECAKNYIANDNSN